MSKSKTAKGAAKKTAKPAKSTKAPKAGTRGTKKAPTPKEATTTAPSKPKKLGVLSAAHQVLTAAGAPMTSQEMIAALAEQKLWASPNGKTPAQTLYAAIIREIKAKGDAARFAKTERGKFVARQV